MPPCRAGSGIRHIFRPATNVPRPGTLKITPSSRSSPSARFTVAADRPVSSASSMIYWMRGPISPARMPSRSSPASWT